MEISIGSDKSDHDCQHMTIKLFMYGTEDMKSIEGINAIPKNEIFKDEFHSSTIEGFEQDSRKSDMSASKF